jgi:F-type H+-transporting ATPase subunit epsilon
MKKDEFSFFKLSIATVEKEICSLDVLSFFAHGVDGYFQILKDHVPFLTKLLPGCVFYTNASDGKREGIVLSGGLVEVQPKCVFVFADVVIRSFEIDYEKVKIEEFEMAHKLSVLKSSPLFKKDSYELLKAELLLASAKLSLIKNIKKFYK